MVEMTIGFLVGGLLAGLTVWRIMARYLRRMRHQGKKLLARTRSAEKLAELGTLTGHLAHEIRNPLSTIKLNLQLLAEDVDDLAQAARDGKVHAENLDDPVRFFERQGRKLKAITAEAQRLAETLTDFLRYAGKMELHLVRQDINEILEDLIDFYEPQALTKNVQMRQCLSPEAAICRIDVDLIKQAILNLFINATQAMNQGGELMVRSSLGDNEARIEIIDTGAGIPDEMRDKVFDAYYTTRSGGTGLGLPTCRRIIEEHGGHIELDSEPGKGTRFLIALPITE